MIQYTSFGDPNYLRYIEKMITEKRYWGKRSCSKSGKKYSLSREDVRQLLVNEPYCFYCKVLCKFYFNQKESSRKKDSLTFDRKDCNVGYVKDNVVTCCHGCNNRKSKIEHYFDRGYLDFYLQFLGA